jgi:starch synthase
MKIVLAAPEAAPYSKTGGLGDMTASLAQALRGLNLGPVLAVPRYRNVSVDGFEPSLLAFDLGDRRVEGRVWTKRGPVEIRLIDVPAFFDRPGYYGEGGRDYPDNALRFAGFCLAVLETAKSFAGEPVVLHAHDWQAALIPIYLAARCAEEPVLRNVRTVLTVHNLAYQGLFDAGDYHALGLPYPSLPPFLEFYGRMNLLKAGILAADAVTTVSPSYAREVLTPEYGCGLEGVLREREADFSGILNGIDLGIWNPAGDPFLPAPYTAATPGGKAACKKALQERLGLRREERWPLAGIVSRLVEQKGIDWIEALIREKAAEPVQWAVLGSGDPELEEALKALPGLGPDRISVTTGYDEALAHRIQAGADFFLMPSRFEPCGTSQMHALRYGTIPVVRATGGLKDTVTDADREPEMGDGFAFDAPGADGLRDAFGRALRAYADPIRWKRLAARAMARDFSWERSALKYRRLYETILARPRRVP